jgi:hypothetical protein
VAKRLVTDQKQDGDELAIRLRRSGQGIEVSWATDGRESGPVAATYLLLASASPRDFDGVQPVEVAGNQLLATRAFPAHRSGGRHLTFFKVE